MLQMGTLFLIILTVLGRVIADSEQVIMGSPPQALLAPTVQLDSATVTGVARESTNEFLGIPFAQPPTGNLRFQVPQALPPYSTDFSATEFGFTCPQQKQAGVKISCELYPGQVNLYDPKVYDDEDGEENEDEDCLTLNVATPATVTTTSKLPVVVWIYGGGFVLGGTAGSLYNGSKIVRKSISLGVPVVYVSINYRTNAFGFLASKEVKDAGAGNLGLRDQRLALKWINQYISVFGGDPAKVTIWGQSAGAISIALQMLTNGGDTEGLFRAAFMQSGAPIPVGDITNGQKYYDFLVEKTDCSSTGDTLQCLREAPFDTLKAAIDETPGTDSYQALALAWMPRVDEDFLPANPQTLVLNGTVANIPFISGNANDEGTYFSFSNSNITEEEELVKYLETYWLPKASSDEIAKLLEYYPQDPAEGSPFDTGDNNQYSKQFKRLAAFQGDAVFEAPRRFFIQNRPQEQNVWTYTSTRAKWIGNCGSFHGSDLILMLFLDGLGYGDLTNYFLRFVTNLDPNVGEQNDEIFWPQYKFGTGENETMLTFQSIWEQKQDLTTDTYRLEKMEYMMNLTLKYPL